MMATDSDSEMKVINVGSPDLEHYRKLVQTYLSLHLYQSALFWADKVVELTCGNPRDVYWLAQCMFQLKQYHRAAKLLSVRKLDKMYVLCNTLAVRCYLEANDYNEALKTINLMDLDVFLSTTHPLNNCMLGPDSGIFDDTPRYQIQSSVLLLKGKVLEAMDNRILAAESYRHALKCDVYCYEAFECLIQHNMLTAAEEQELLHSLPIEEQCSSEEAEVLVLLYKSKLKKYHTPTQVAEPSSRATRNLSYKTANMTPLLSTTIHSDLNVETSIVPNNSMKGDQITTLNPNISHLLENSVDMIISKAEQMYYNCDYQRCLALTENILKQDEYHTTCLPIHISCLVQLSKSNSLFILAHRLVDLYPNWAISWFAVGCYYYIIGKRDLARKYLAKATTLDRLFGPAWLAYGHSFAVENEHDQAMAAYFKASQLMKGCHLPLMYIGLECGLTNNTLAEKFFQQAFKIAPDDPFVLHEMGVIAYQNCNGNSSPNYLKAENHFRDALKIIKSRKITLMPESWAPLYNNLGHVLRKQKKYAEALECHHEALNLMPQNSSTYSAIAYCHALMNNLETSVDWFHEALGLKRDDTFSTTMLTYVIDQLSEEQSPYPDAPLTIPNFEPLEESGVQETFSEEQEAPAETGNVNETADMSMSCEMDITDPAPSKD